jgi:hypothetical protein
MAFEFKMLRQTDEPMTWVVIDSDTDYDRLYHRINKQDHQEGDDKLMIVEVKCVFNPSKK